VGVLVGVSVGVSVGVLVGVSVGVFVGVSVNGTGWAMVLDDNVNAPVRAKARPSKTTPLSTVIETLAMIVPLQTEFAPRVQLLPTCQKTLAACAPLIKKTWLSAAVIKVDPIWKMKTAFESP